MILCGTEGFGLYLGLRAELFTNHAGDFSANRQRSSRGRARCIEHVQRLFLLNERKILNQISAGRHGLGANTRAAFFQVLDANFRDELLQ